MARAKTSFPVPLSPRSNTVDSVAKARNQPRANGIDDLLGVAVTEVRPVDHTAGEVRRRGKHVEQLVAARCQARVAGRRPGDEQGRILHQRAVTDDVGERLIPVLAEDDVVVCQ